MMSSAAKVILTIHCGRGSGQGVAFFSLAGMLRFILYHYNIQIISL
jgi:hypothetical protein